jgi:CheY-like chemotaxis protein
MRKSFKVKKSRSKFDTAMLVDDNEMDNFINQKVIEASGFAEKVYTNTNGLSALEFLNNLYIQKSQLPDMLPEVIFVDLNMPLINGFQFIEKFYEMPVEFVENSKIAILTSSLSPKDREIAQQINPRIVFLSKPLTAEGLAMIN